MSKSLADFIVDFADPLNDAARLVGDWRRSALIVDLEPLARLSAQARTFESFMAVDQPTQWQPGDPS